MQNQRNIAGTFKEKYSDETNNVKKVEIRLTASIAEYNKSTF